MAKKQQITFSVYRSEGAKNVGRLGTNKVTNSIVSVYKSEDI